jgi:ATP-dependent protease Clp ATPase subunit
MVRALVPAADGDVALAEFGIVYVDEVDKLAGNLGGAMGGGVSTRAVQSSMLKLMEDAEVLIQVGATPPSQLVKMGGGPKMIRTRHILFIMSGAFADLEAELRQDAQMKMDAQLERNAQLEREAQKRREAQLKRSAELQPGAELKDSANAEELEAHALGTEDPIPSAADVIRAASADLLQNPLASATAADLIRFGLEPEFVGRIPVRVACRALGHEELVRVLTEAEGSVLEQMKADFDGYGIELQLTEGALAEVARRASSQHTGARGLVTVLEQTLRDFKFELPSTNIKKLVVCEETVRLPQQKLEQLLAGERGATDSM